MRLTDCGRSKLVKHDIRLSGPQARGARISSRVLAELTKRLTDTMTRVVRFAADGRSNLQRCPEWVVSAVEFDIVGLAEGSTVLTIEQKTLGEVAPTIFSQYSLPLWQDNTLQPSMSSLDLLRLTFQDASNKNVESDRLDRNILASIHDFESVLSLGFDAISLLQDIGPVGNGAQATLDRKDLEAVETLRQAAPPNQKTIVSGTLDELAGSRRSFIVQLSNYKQVRGILPSGDLADFARLFNRKVVVDGEAVFRPSGQLAHVVANAIHAATDQDVVWETIPKPAAISADAIRVRSRLVHESNHLALIRDKWPGDESEEDVLRALEAIS